MKFYVILVFLIAGNSFAQVLDNRNGEAFTDKPFFNEQFIRDNKLKKLNGSFVYKRQGDIMRDTEFSYVYEFNERGQLISSFETRTDDGTKDTNWVKYQYDSLGRLTNTRKTNQEGYLTIQLNYDSLGRIASEEILNEIDSNGVIVRTLKFNKERYTYDTFPNQIKRTRFNNYDLPYMEEVSSFNELGYLIERTERYKMTSQQFTFTYEYNEKGKLSAIRKTSNTESGPLEDWTFAYDEYGNLIQKHIFRNGVFTTDIQIVYNSKTKLLSSVITRQVSTNFMMIIRFLDYEFYD